ncbi:MAG: DUF5677 domain-containing protein [Candidatus Roizmanbacteria bacterium]
MKLTDKQKSFLENFSKLLVYGHNELAKVGLKQKRTSLKKKLLFFMMGATQSEAESIFKIMTPTQLHSSIYFNSAIILFRSITENLMNLSFIYACDSQKNATIFHIDWLQSTLKYSNRYKRLMTKYPQWNLVFGDKAKADDWNGYIQILKKVIAKDQKRYKLPNNSELPPLEQRCMQHDQYLSQKNKLNQGNSLEKMYVTYYPYFSGISHLRSSGLNSFRNYQDNGSFSMSIDSSPVDIEAIIPVTYANYLMILRFFLQKFKVYDGEAFREHKRTLKLMFE